MCSPGVLCAIDFCGTNFAQVAVMTALVIKGTLSKIAFVPQFENVSVATGVGPGESALIPRLIPANMFAGPPTPCVDVMVNHGGELWCRVVN